MPSLLKSSRVKQLEVAVVVNDEGHWLARHHALQRVHEPAPVKNHCASWFGQSGMTRLRQLTFSGGLARTSKGVSAGQVPLEHVRAAGD
jgi:hypothetical protein